MRTFLHKLPRDETGTLLPVFLLSLPFGVLGVYLPLYGRELGASATQVGALFTAFGLVGVLARPLVGLGADRLGRKPFILAGAATYALAAALFAASVSLPLLFAARLAQGLASALLWVATAALLADLGGDARGRLFGRLATANNSGSIAGTVAGYGVVLALGIVAGWRVVFLAAAGAALLALLLLRHGLPATPPSAPGPSARPASRRSLLFLLALGFVVAASYTMLAPVVLLYLQDRFRAGELGVGLAFAPAAAVYALAPGRLGSLGDRYGRGPVMSGALLSSGVASLLFPLAPSLAVLAGIWVIEAVLASAALPARDVLVSEVSGGDVRGRAYGVYAAVTGLGAALGPLAGGWLYDHMGHTWPFGLNAAILAAVSALIAMALPRTGDTNLRNASPSAFERQGQRPSTETPA